ncbi:hypothetical protein JJB99_03070 [Bradyrhizobium diazoefficiens]|uniref:hypothetical protein n=1 Tax=Bradyrhizobium diazoefficiens TaxID=1355477 RepID=UPI00190D6DC7|nr:hypothetical protein [Bradyrhizobium diazoefficiens]QQO15186.1 hypothetical protein JJB99_03070 [Bradyrhizobium diazoefficiens]
MIVPTAPLELPSGEEVEVRIPVKTARVCGCGVGKHVTAPLHQTQLPACGRNLGMLEVDLVHRMGEDISDLVDDPQIIPRRLFERPGGVSDSDFRRCR